MEISTVGVLVDKTFIFQFNHALYSDSTWEAYIDRTYVLDGKYKNFSAKIAPLGYWTKEGESNVGEIKFYVDDQLVYTTGVFKSTIMEPLDVEFDVTGALKLRVVASRNNYSLTHHLGICDPKLMD